MLPFLKPKQVASVIISKRKPDGSNEVSHAEGDEDNGLESCMQDFIQAHNSKDAKAMAAAFKAAFEICESQPQEEASPEALDDESQE